MARKIAIKEYQQGEILLFPEYLDMYIPADAPARLIDRIVEQLDLTEVMKSYQGGGCSAYSPRMLIKVLFFCYMNNIYSCRKIERYMNENIHCMWLSGKQFPKYNTINNFRSLHLKDTINQLFTQVVMMLMEMGVISLEEEYIDGTKLESRANKYTFVWRKSVEKNKAKLEAKIRNILQQIEEGILSDSTGQVEEPTPIDPEVLRERIAQINRENKSKEQKKLIKEIEKKHLPKLEEYTKKIEQCGDRNNFSKTDTDATFMRMKEDHLKNGQLKPAFNLQISTESQFITNFDFFPNPADTLTFIPFLEKFQERFSRFPNEVCADAGYGSEENYAFMDKNHINAYVKYNYFHQEQKSSFKDNPFLPENLYYNADEDYLVCPMGQHMNFVRENTRTSESGYVSHTRIYQAQNCEGCPLRTQCFKAKENRRIEINPILQKYKKNAKSLLLSEKGVYHRSKRCIEPEPVFGQIKENKHYRRFRHFGKEMITMDFAILAIAFNIGKLWNRKSGKSSNFDVFVSNMSLTILVSAIFSYIRNKKTFRTLCNSKSELKSVA
jgi:transposase